MIESYTQGKIFKVLVGNKCDMDYYRVITEEEGKKIAEKYNMTFFQVSAKTGDNINKIFNSLAIQMTNIENENKNKNEKPPIKKESKSIFNIFSNLIFNNNKEKIILSDDKNNIDDIEIDRLNQLLKKERSNNEKLIKKIESLDEKLKNEKDENKFINEKLRQLEIKLSNQIKELKEEKNSNQIINEKLREKDMELLKRIEELDIEKNKNHILEEKIKKLEDYEEKLQYFKNNNNVESKESLINSILIKDKEINELKEKLSRYPFELNEGEKMMTVNFISGNQKINNYSIICKNTDIFNTIEKKLYDEYKEFYESENFFTIHGNKINKLKSLEENKIKNNDVIMLNVNDI